MNDKRMINVRLLTHADLFDVVEIHKTVFYESTLTQLGDKLTYQYYLWQFENSHLLYPIGAFVNNQLVGFCFSGVFKDSETQFILDNKRLFITSFIVKPKLFFNIEIRKQIITSLQKLTRKQKNEISYHQKPVVSSSEKFGILSIAIDDRYQGYGIGSTLMREVESYAKQSGFTSMRLTVHVDNQKAISFYQKCDWAKVFSPSGIWQGSMRKDLV